MEEIKVKKIKGKLKWCNYILIWKKVFNEKLRKWMAQKTQHPISEFFFLKSKERNTNCIVHQMWWYIIQHSGSQERSWVLWPALTVCSEILSQKKRWCFKKCSQYWRALDSRSKNVSGEVKHHGMYMRSRQRMNVMNIRETEYNQNTRSLKLLIKEKEKYQILISRALAWKK